MSVQPFDPLPSFPEYDIVVFRLLTLSESVCPESHLMIYFDTKTQLLPPPNQPNLGFAKRFSLQSRCLRDAVSRRPL